MDTKFSWMPTQWDSLNQSRKDKAKMVNKITNGDVLEKKSLAEDIELGAIYLIAGRALIPRDGAEIYCNPPWPALKHGFVCLEEPHDGEIHEYVSINWFLANAIKDKSKPTKSSDKSDEIGDIRWHKMRDMNYQYIPYGYGPTYFTEERARNVPLPPTEGAPPDPGLGFRVRDATPIYVDMRDIINRPILTYVG